MNEHQDLLTTKELCDYLKVSRYWVIRKRQKKKNPIPTIALGKRDFRYPITKVLDWLHAGYAVD